MCIIFTVTIKYTLPKGSVSNIWYISCSNNPPYLGCWLTQAGQRSRNRTLSFITWFTWHWYQSYQYSQIINKLDSSQAVRIGTACLTNSFLLMISGFIVVLDISSLSSYQPQKLQSRYITDQTLSTGSSLGCRHLFKIKMSEYTQCSKIPPIPAVFSDFCPPANSWSWPRLLTLMLHFAGESDDNDPW